MPYAEIDDVRLHIRQNGSGRVALFIHGFPLDSTMWIEQLDALAGLRRCIAVDLRGFGRSSPVNGEPLAMERHAADIAGVLDIVSEEQADIIGLSMGGYVALAFAEMYPDRLRSLALIDTRAEADTAEAKDGRDVMAERLLAEGRAAIAEALQAGLLAPEASIAARARLRNMIEACPYETIVAALGGMRDRPDRSQVLAGIAVPTAVVVGEFDSITPPSDAERMASALPHASLTVVPRAGHMTPIENPAAVNDALKSLFTG
jgi:pimeloyl-ACP methyl ester carboxylesterase